MWVYFALSNINYEAIGMPAGTGSCGEEARGERLNRLVCF